MNRTLLSLIFVTATVGGYAQQRAGIPIGVDFGVFFPTDSTVKSVFGSNWYRVGITPISLQKDERWRFTFDVAVLSQTRFGEKARLTPVTFGFTRSFGKGKTQGARPYVALRAGPYWGSVKSVLLGIDKNQVGLDINGAVGLTFNNAFYIEARYDYMSDFSGINFSGFFLSAGVKLFEFRL